MAADEGGVTNFPKPLRYLHNFQQIDKFPQLWGTSTPYFSISDETGN
jgi:hypothetical protein